MNSEDLTSYVLGTRQIKLDELSPQQWLNIASNVVLQLKWSLGYLPMVIEHSHALTRMSNHYSCFVGTTKADGYAYPDSSMEIDASTRLLPLTGINTRWPFAKANPAKLGEEFKETYLFLCDKPSWVLLTRDVRVEMWGSQIGYRNTCLTFSLVGDHELIKLIRNAKTWWNIIASLRYHLREAIRTRQEIMGRLRNSQAVLDGIINRLEPTKL